jgi:hypothetical protein
MQVHQWQKNPRSRLFIGRLDDDCASVAAGELAADFAMLEMIFGDNGKNPSRRNQFLHALKCVLEHGAPADEVHILLRQLPSFEPLDISLQPRAIACGQD